jgi:hypothetical protein
MMTKPFAITSFFISARQGSVLLFWSAAAMAVLMVVTMALPLVDPTQLAGVSTWEKPSKFLLSFVVHFLTVAWALSLLEKPTRAVNTTVWMMFAAAWFEILYISFRASRGEGSHFNSDTLIAGVMYSLMGLGALTLTASTGFIGWRLFKERTASVFHLAAGVGLMLGALLGTIGGGHLSNQPSHWIGGDQTDATGLFFFHWSTTGGDLRVSHFIGLHALQVVPLAALSQRRWAVYVSAFAVTAAMVVTFIMALMGMPLFRV